MKMEGQELLQPLIIRPGTMCYALRSVEPGQSQQTQQNSEGTALPWNNLSCGSQSSIFMV